MKTASRLPLPPRPLPRNFRFGIAAVVEMRHGEKNTDIIREALSFARGPESKRYADQIKTMADNCRKFIKARPGVVINVSINFPNNAAILAVPLSVAITNRLISADESGLAMLKAMWDWDSVTEPTASMIQLTLEMLEMESGAAL